MNRLKTLLKQNRVLYLIYNYFFSFILNFIGLFVKTNNKLILFNSFGGRKYDDNPKAIYEYMKNNRKYKDYKMVWALDSYKTVEGLNIDYVKNNSLKFFITALKAKYWITNTSIERGLKFKKRNTIYVNTWHGSVIKKIGNEFSKEKRNFRVSECDYFFTQSHIDIDYFSKVGYVKKDKMVLSGYPRNDELCSVTKKEIENIKKKLNIHTNKKIIIYAPTLRDYEYDSNGNYIKPEVNIKKWKERLSNEYILLIRAHYEINKFLDIKDDDFIINVTDYPILNDLLKISDIMISDYSSIMIDYSILERPIFCFAYDYEKYMKERGTAYNLNKELPNGVTYTEDDLIKSIINCNFDEQKMKTKKFKNKHVEVCGNASTYIDKIIK